MILVEMFHDCNDSLNHHHDDHNVTNHMACTLSEMAKINMVNQ